jgi:hypothetical protein
MQAVTASETTARDGQREAAPAAASSAQHSEQQVLRQLEAIVQGVLGASIPADQPLLEVLCHQSC